jgi:hypothetical protein
MDSIFDEDADEVGGEIEAYCPSPRCKADTTHTIISMYEDEVRRVQCVVCGEVHAYRKPRGDSVEEPGGPEVTPKKRSSSKMTWEDAMSRVPESDLGTTRPYTVRDTYEQGELVFHPVFDIGIVTELLPDNKVEITFRDRPRVMAHNLGVAEASRMPSISEAPPPRDVKKKKRVKKKDDSAAAAAVRSRAQIGEALELARHAASAKMDESQRTVSSQLEAKAKATKVKPVKGKDAVADVEGKPKGKSEPVKETVKAEAKKVEARAVKGDAKPEKAGKAGKAAAPSKEEKAPAKAAAAVAKPAAKPAKDDKKAKVTAKPTSKPVAAKAAGKAAKPAKAGKSSGPAKAAKPAAKAKAAKPAGKAKPAAKAKAGKASGPAKKPAKGKKK